MSIKHYHTLYQYLIIVFGVILLQSIFFSFSQGEITLDGTLGERGSLVGPHYGISADMGHQEGNNLFHSFGQFTLNRYESATFTGPAMVENIIGRVTGGTASWIDGVLRSNIQGANLYLLNPSGIIFGPNACLDLTGSFHVSTSDYINLGHSGRFDATQPNNSLLTADSPSAFGFLGDNPSDISIQGSFLQSPDGETISIVGGNLELKEESVLLSPNGRINIVSVESAGEAVFTGGSVEVDSFDLLGDISVSGESYISSSGEGGGAVFIRGGRFVLDHSYIWADTLGDIDGGAIDIYLKKDLVVTGGISASTYKGGCGGDIILKVEGLDIIDGGVIEASTFSTGQGGDLKITAKDSLLISGPGSKIYSLVSDSGNAGNIDLTAQTLTISNEGMMSGATNGEGRGAGIILKVESLELTNGGMIDTSTFAAGQGGKVMISAAESVLISNQAGKQDDDLITGITSIASGTSKSGSIEISTPSLTVANDGLISVETRGEGEGGEIELKVGDLFLTDGYILASSSGMGHGGTVTVEATGSVSISGSKAALSSCAFREGDGGFISLSTPILKVSDGGGIRAATLEEGAAGDIILRVGNLTLADKGYITTNSIGKGAGGKLTVSATETVSIFGQKNDGFGSGFFSEATSGGAAGSILLKTCVLKITDGGQINASTLAEGVGGDIEVEADQIYLSNEARIEAASTGNGDAGDIVIKAGDMIYGDHASVATEAIKADGGNIRIDTQNLSCLTDSDITATVKGAMGDGGNIEMNSKFVVLNRSNIIAKAEGGNGGRIVIVSDVFLSTPDSIVSASSRLGIDGTVEIFSPMVDVSSGLVSLPESFLKADDLLPKRCAEKDEASSFHIIEHEGSAPDPDSLLY